jgi:hypothetical protein
LPLAALPAPEIGVGMGTEVALPMLLSPGRPGPVSISVDLPQGWSRLQEPSPLRSDAGTTPFRVVLRVPEVGEDGGSELKPFALTIVVDQEGQRLGEVKLTIAVRRAALPF